MRQEEAQAQVPHSYTTARTLLSILRLSQALARLRFSDYVCQVRHGPLRSAPDHAAPRESLCPPGASDLEPCPETSLLLNRHRP